MIVPGQPAPTLSVATLGGRFDLASDAGENGTMLVFYRGLHCPICMDQLGDLNEAGVSFHERGVALVAISSDDEDRARQAVETSGARDLTVAHSMPLAAARGDWGLWVSEAREGSEEPPLFNEPGIFYIRPDGTIWAAWVQSTPFGRPAVSDLLKAVDFAVDRGYPPRGTHTGPL